MKIILVIWTLKLLEPRKELQRLQMDLKITSITRNIMEIALEQAREGRLHILGKMAEAHWRCA